MDERAGGKLELESRGSDRSAGPTNCLGSMGAMAGVVFGTIYILNPGFGVLEFINDLTPIVGNLDEAGASGLIIFGLQYLGRRRRERSSVREPDRQTPG